MLFQNVIKRILKALVIAFVMLVSPAFATTYNITYELDGGTLASGVSNPATYDDDTLRVLDLPIKSGYVFKGWYENSNFTGDPVKWISANSTSGDKTYYAKWGTLESKFQITTTADIVSDGTGDYDWVAFRMSASGVFYVDWGDDSGVEVIDRRGNTTTQYYSHTYTNTTARSYNVRFDGQATGYSTYRYNPSSNTTRNAGSHAIPAIAFYRTDGAIQYTSVNEGRDLYYYMEYDMRVAGISGSLGAIFPTIGGAAATAGLYDDSSALLAIQPRFMQTFAFCNHLTGSIPAGLFSGVEGRPASNMFQSTFEGCYGLTGSIPAGLFSSVSSTDGASHMFSGTFSGCSGLTGSIPAGLFSGINGNNSASSYMFYHTFSGCSGLTGSIPSGLFSGIQGLPADRMFSYTFSGCSGLTGSIPAGLFSGIRGGVQDYAFAYTFYDCSNLTGPIPADLFSGVSGRPSDYAFESTFGNCTNLGKDTIGGVSKYYVPATLFAGICEENNTSARENFLRNVFSGTGLLESCPGIKATTGFDSYFSGKVACVEADEIYCRSGMVYNSTTRACVAGNDSCSTGFVQQCPSGYAGNTVAANGYYGDTTATRCIASYNITYNLDGGTNNPSNPSVYASDTSSFYLRVPTKSGYVFDGWCDDAGLTQNCSMYKTVDTGTLGDKIFYAKWREFENKFQITTTNISNNDYFEFTMSASGAFYVDWGDGNIELIDRVDNTMVQTYSHTYTNASARSYDIKFDGRTIGYNTTYYVASIRFTNNAKVYGISGSLGALFPTIGGAAATTGLASDSAALLAIQPRFYQTFNGCSNLTGSIPAELFSGIEGQPATYMFYQTFNGCSNLTGSIPAGLFSGIEGQPAANMFSSTFSGCSNLTGSIPSGLFSGIQGQPASYMFSNTFYGCSNLGKNAVGGTSTYYIPATLFAGINTETTAASQMYFVFYNTGLLTSCPSGTIKAITGFESNFNSKVACVEADEIYCKQGLKYDSTTKGCVACTSGDTCYTGFVQECPTGYLGNTTVANGYDANSTATKCLQVYNITYNLDGGINNANNPSTYTADSSIYMYAPTKSGYVFAGWYSDSNLENAVTNIPTGSTGDKTFYAKWREFENKFQITTTDDIGNNGYFAFSMTAAGVFYVDWGDGTIERIDRTNNNTTLNYSHTYTNTAARSYDIKFDGQATRYTTVSASAPINFDATSKAKIYGISGSLGAIFPTIGGATATAGLASNSTTLWAIQPRFYQTFNGCSNLTGSIPAELFSGIEGQPATYMFYQTFNGCSNLTGSIPAELFSGIEGQPAIYMFYQTFRGCSNLTGSIPAGLFSGIQGQPASYMFSNTFYGCSNLGKNAVGGTSTYYIPATLFAGINTGTTATSQMSSVFYGTGLLTSCPSGTIKAITGFESNFNSKVACVEADEIYCKQGLKYDLTTHACAVCDVNDTCDTGFVQECPSGYLSGNAFADNGYDGASTATQCLQTYNITYNLNGGTNNANNPATYTIESTSIYMGAPTKSGYVFAGWYSDSNLENVVTVIPAGSTGDKTFYAKWRTFENKFQITTTDNIVSDGTGEPGQNDHFAFSMTAAGVFYVDWGDGSPIEVISRPDTTFQIYSHTYTNTTARSYTIRFDGYATEYSSGSGEAIKFGDFSGTSVNENRSVGSTNTRTKVYGISGSLGAIFPTIGGAAATTGLASDSAALKAIQPLFRYTFYNCSNLTGSIPSELFSGIEGQPAANMFYYTFYNCSGLGKNAVGGTSTYYIPATLFAGINTGTTATNQMSSVFSGTGLLTSCPSGTIKAITGFESKFNGKVACVADDEIYCKQGLKYDLTTHACAVCDVNDTCDTGFVQECPTGYLGNTTVANGYDSNSTATKCFQSYNITYNMDGGTNNVNNPAVYTAASSTITLQDPLKTNYKFMGWYDNDQFTGSAITAIPNGSTGDITLYAKWEAFVNKFQITTTDNIGQNDYFAFRMSAAGVFYVDWGDGTIERIDRTNNTTSQIYSHTYTNTTARSYDIKFDGLATGYNDTSASTPAIEFGNGFSGTSVNENKSVSGTNTKVYGISGSLGAIFPTIGGAAATAGLASNSAALLAIQPRFLGTFINCSNLTGSIPSELFSGIEGQPADHMFNQTFFSCSSLTGSIPSGLFSGIQGQPAQQMFYYTFRNCTNLGKNAVGGTSTYYIPSTLFAGINTGTTATSQMTNVFLSTGLLTSCPSGTIQATTGFESNFNSKVACVADDEIYCKRGLKYDSTTKACATCDANDTCNTGFVQECPNGYLGNITINNGSSRATQCLQASSITYNMDGGTNNTNNLSVYTLETPSFYLKAPTKSGYVFAGWCDDAGLTQNCSISKNIDTSVAGDKTFYAKWRTFENKFQITTTDNMVSDGSSYDHFAFQMAAAGVFYVDWGDGTIELIDRVGNTTSQIYSHTYTNTTARSYDIKFDGLATGYNDTAVAAATIRFSNFSGTSVNENRSVSGNTSAKVYGMSGSLGALFPTIGGAAATTGLASDSAALLAIQPRFTSTCYGCSNLTGPIPAGLFSGIEGQPADYMFSGTFRGCSNLTGSIPAGLFSGIQGQPAQYMFAHTFYGCSNLTGSIPAGLFSGIEGQPADYMFNQTFYGCTNLGKDTINGTRTYYVPATLFAGIDTGTTASYQMSSVFSNTGLLYYCPSSGTIKATTGFESNFDSRVACVADDEIYCKQGLKYDSTTKACATCDANDTCNTGFVQECPTGYLGNTTVSNGYDANSTATQCLQTHNITYNLDGGTNGVNNPSLYTIDTPSFTLGIPTKSGYVFDGWCDDAGLQNCLIDKTVDTSITNDQTFYAKWRLFENKFQITTTNNIGQNDYFAFRMSAAGIFYVDWGDGTIELIDRIGNTTSQIYSHTYTNTTARSYDIKFDGLATGYNDTSDYTPAINFGGSFSGTSVNENKSVSSTNTKVYGISGSLGAIFPTIGGAAATTGLAGNSAALWAIQPRFTYMFYDCTNLTGSIPAGLFSGIEGQPASYMFNQTFYGCTNLGKNAVGGTSTYYIPATLFAGINTETTATSQMYFVFYNTGLRSSCPSGTIKAITGFESNFRSTSYAYAVACVADDEIYCKQGLKYDSTTKGCVACTSGDTCYTGFVQECPTGYLSNTTTATGFDGNSTATQCIVVNYNINYYANGGTNDANNPSSYTVEDLPITLQDPTRTGYTFGGWYDNYSLTGSAITGITTSSMGNKTFYAKWTPVTYNITYNLDSGTNNANNPATYNITSSTITLQDPLKTNYKFMGWYDNDQFTGSAITEITAGSTGNVTLYAKWEAFTNKFQITTTNNIVSDGTGSNDYFAFWMSAAGVFYVDWGDGIIERIDRTNNTTSQIYSHTYTNTTARSYDIKFDGLATGYNNNTAVAVATIRFSNFSDDTSVNENRSVSSTNTKVYGISGSLGALFPTIGGAAATTGLASDSAALLAIQPRFTDIFYGCSNLTGSIPAGLFSGIQGQPADYMFSNTFSGCSNLTGSIPAGLFSGISGAPAGSMFAGTFSGCSNLTGSIPAGLFSGIQGQPAPRMFNGTFYGCSNLTGSIPAGLFSGIEGQPAANMFSSTFSGCSNLTGSIPSGLFSGIQGQPADYMFSGTFSACYNLGKNWVGGTSTYYVPATLFAGIDTGTTASYQMSNVFSYDTGLLYSCPSGTNQAITGFENDFYSRVACVDNTKVYCREGYRFDTTTYACVECQSGDTCPARGAEYSCPNGMLGNANSMACSIAYNITYELDGGTNNPDNPSVYTEASATITLLEPTKSGYVFVGWYSDSNLENEVTEIPNGSTGAKTFYAKWAPIYNITYNSMGADTEASSNPIQYYVRDSSLYFRINVNYSYSSTSYSVGLNSPSKAGFEFTGWCAFDSAEAAASASYTCQNPVSDLTANSGYTASYYLNVLNNPGNYYLYAQWAPIYNITYNSMGADAEASDNPVQYYVNGSRLYYKNDVNNSYYSGGTSSIVYLSSPSKAGFASNGWCAFSSTSAAAAANYTCAQPVKYLTANPDYTGSDYAGYLNVSNGGSDLYLYAQWIPTYSITYNSMGADTEASSNPVQYYVDGSILYYKNDINASYWNYISNYTSLNTPTKNGYRLAGWCAFDSAEAAASASYTCQNPVSDLTANSGYTDSYYLNVSNGGNLYLYAKWMPVYTITYNSMGADTEASNNPVVYYVDEKGLYSKTDVNSYWSSTLYPSLGAPTKYGYGFVGWCAFNSAEAAASAGYDCQYPVKTIAVDSDCYSGDNTCLGVSNGGNLYLYAKWAPIYSITYDTTGATSTPYNPYEYWYDNSNYHYYHPNYGDYTGSLVLASPSGSQEFRGWYVCTSYQGDVNTAANSNDCTWFSETWSGSGETQVYGMYGANLYAYASFGPQTIQCSPGTYAYYDGSSLYCNYCPENYYCDGMNLSGGYDLTAEDNGKYRCGTQYANRTYHADKQYSAEDSTSESDCSVCPAPEIEMATSDNYYFMSMGDTAVNRQTATTINECVAPVVGLADMNEAEKCMMQAMMTPEQLQAEYGDAYYEYGFDQPCDLATADLGLLSCRYNSNTKEYSDCSAMLTPCDTADLANYVGPMMEGEPSDLFDLELRKKGLTQSTLNQNTFFADNNLAANIVRTGNGTLVKEFTAACDTQTCPATKYARIEYVNGVGTASCETCPAGSFCPGNTYSFANGDFTVDPTNANVYTAGKFACIAGSTSTAGAATCTCVSGSAYNPAGNSIVNMSVGNMSTTKTPEVITLSVDKEDIEYPACANVYVSAINSTAFNSWVSGGMSSDDLLTQAGARVVICKYNAENQKYDLCSPAFTACNGTMAQLMLAPTGTIISNLAQMFGEGSSLPDDVFEEVSATLGVDALQTANACPDPDMPQAIGGSCATGYYWENYERKPGETYYTGNNCCPNGYACCLAGSEYNPDPKVARCEECSGASCPTTYTEHVVCPAGTYIDQSAIGTNAQCVECPLGHYCPGVSVAWDGQSTLTDAEAGKPECPDGSYADKTGMTSCAVCANGMSTGGVTGSTSDSACSKTTCVDGSQYDPAGTTFVSGAGKQSALIMFYDTKNNSTYQKCTKAYVSVLDNTVFANGIANATADELSKSGMRLIMCGYDDKENKYTDCSYAIPACDTTYSNMMLNYTTEQIATAIATQYGAPALPNVIMGNADASGALGIDGVRNFYGSASSGTPTCAASCPVGYEWENYYDDKYNETRYTGNTCCPDGYACCLAGWKYDSKEERCVECSGDNCPTTYTKTLICPAGQYVSQTNNGIACAECPAGYACPGVEFVWDGESTISDTDAGKFGCKANTFSGTGASSCTACPDGSTSTAGASACTCVSGAAYNPAGNSIVNMSVGNMSTTKTPEVITLSVDKEDIEYPACANVYVSAINSTAFNSWVSGGMSSDDLLTQAGARVVMCKYNAEENKYNLCSPAFTACNGQIAQLMLAPTGTIISNLAQMFGEGSSLPDDVFEEVSDTLGVDALQTANACPDPDMPQAIGGSCATGYYWASEYDDKYDETRYTGNNCCPNGYACCLAGTTYDLSGKSDTCVECSGASCPTTYTEHVVCPAGTYIDQSAIGTNAQCVECPLGHYCPGVSVAWDGQSTLTDDDAGKHACEDGSYADKTGLAACITCGSGMSTGGTGATSDSACSTTTCVDGSQYDPAGTTFVSGATKQSSLITLVDTKKGETYQECAKAYISVLDNTVFANGMANATADELSKSGMRLVICRFDDKENKYTNCSYAVPACDGTYQYMMMNYTTDQIAGALASNFNIPGIPDNIFDEDASGALGIDGVRNFYGSVEGGVPTCAASCPVGYYWESYENEKNNETIYTGNTCCPDGYACCLAGWKYDSKEERCVECSGANCPTTYTKVIKPVSCPATNSYYTSPAPINTQGGSGVMELDMPNMELGVESSYGTTQNECVAIRLYYESSTPFMTASSMADMTASDYVDAGASVAFCKYNPNTGHYDGDCTPKYSLCSTDNVMNLFASGDSVGVMKAVLGITNDNTIGNYFTESSSDLSKDNAKNRCSGIVCPDASDFSNMNLSGAGMMQMGNGMEGSYGSTPNDCVSMRVYYNDGSVLFDGNGPSMDINDWVDAGASIAFCKYNTGSAETDLCTPKYSMCSDDNLMTLMAAGDSVGIMQAMLGINGTNTLGTYFTQSPSSLASATATNRCGVDCTLVENSTGSDDGNGGCGCATGYEWNSSKNTCDGISVSINWAGVNEPGEAGTCTYGGTLSTPTAPELTGYAFAGWTVGHVVANNNNVQEQDNGEEIGKGE